MIFSHNFLMTDNMSDRTLWSYRDKILRVVEESLEVSLVLCNSEMHEFTLAKIFDIFNQILTTGFVLNTGYWPYYNTLKKQPICVCARYGIQCRHFKHNTHWIDLEAISSDNSTVFSTKANGILNLTNSDIDVIPVTGGVAGYSLNIKLTFQYKKIERGRPRRKKDENVNINRDQFIQVSIYCRYNIQREYYPAIHTIMFQPSPFFYETYGTYFSRLIQVRPTVLATHCPPDINQKYFAVHADNMPHFSLLLQHVNLPLYNFPQNVIAVYSYMEPARLRKSTHNRGTQTDEVLHVGDPETGKFNELVKQLKPLWNYSLENDSKTASCESICSSHSSMNHCSLPCYLNESTTEIKDDELPLNAISESIKNEINNNCIRVDDNKNVSVNCSEEEQINININYDKDYDVQWPRCGYQKFVSKRRSKKKTQVYPLYREFLMESRKNVCYLGGSQKERNLKLNNEQIHFHNEHTYASVLKTIKTEKPCTPPAYQNDQPGKFTVYDTYKNDKYFQWFEKQFPEIQKRISKVKEEIEENFSIAEEVVKEDMERYSETNFWWDQ